MRSILPRWVFSGRSSRFRFEILVLIRPPLPVQRLHIPFFRIMLIIAHDADKINRSFAGFGGRSRKKNTDSCVRVLAGSAFAGLLYRRSTKSFSPRTRERLSSAIMRYAPDQAQRQSL